MKIRLSIKEMPRESIVILLLYNLFCGVLVDCTEKGSSFVSRLLGDVPRASSLLQESHKRLW